MRLNEDHCTRRLLFTLMIHIQSVPLCSLGFLICHLLTDCSQYELEEEVRRVWIGIIILLTHFLQGHSGIAEHKVAAYIGDPLHAALCHQVLVTTLSLSLQVWTGNGPLLLLVFRFFTIPYGSPTRCPYFVKFPFIKFSSNSTWSTCYFFVQDTNKDQLTNIETHEK